MERLYIIGREELPRELTLGAGERADLTLIVLPGTSCNLEMDINLTGEGAEASISGLYVCGGSERVSISVNLRHGAGRCVSRQLFTGVVGGNAASDFYGRIVVAPDAQKTEAYQANHNLLLSDGARADTRPQLEIYADDVKCSHGATVGRLDEEEQFYMRSRGISLAEARILQIMSFLSPVLETVRDEAASEALAAELETAIRGMETFGSH